RARAPPRPSFFPAACTPCPPAPAATAAATSRTRLRVSLIRPSILSFFVICFAHSGAALQVARLHLAPGLRLSAPSFARGSRGHLGEAGHRLLVVRPLVGTLARPLVAPFAERGRLVVGRRVPGR